MATKKKAAEPIEEEDDDDPRPAKKKKKKKKAAGNQMMIIIVVGVVLGVVLIAGGSTAAYFAFKRPAPAPPPQVEAQADENNRPNPREMVAGNIKEGNPAKKGGVANNVRGAAYRNDRRNELANINKMHAAWSLDPGPKTLDSYLAYIQRDFRPGHDAIKEGYYKVNVKAKTGTPDIVAGEVNEDTPGHLVVRGNGTLEHVPAATFKAALP